MSNDKGLEQRSGHPEPGIDWSARASKARDKAGWMAWDRATEILDAAAGDMPQPWRNETIALLAEHHPANVIADALATLRCVESSIRDDAWNHKNMMRRAIETLEKLPQIPEQRTPEASTGLGQRLDRISAIAEYGLTDPPRTTQATVIGPIEKCARLCEEKAHSLFAEAKANPDREADLLRRGEGALLCAGAIRHRVAAEEDQRTTKAAPEDGAIVALQAQLDDVAEALGEERMRAADGYHGTAVRALIRACTDYPRPSLEVRQLAAIAEVLGNTNGDPEVSIGMVRELKTDLERLSVQAGRVAQAWDDDPTSLATENAVRELSMRTPPPACGAPTTLGPCTRMKGHLSEGHWHVGAPEELDKAVTAFWAVSRAARTGENVTSETDALARVVHEAIAYGRKQRSETPLRDAAGRTAVDIMARWIVDHRPYLTGGGDHACRKCYPGGELASKTFLCGYHLAEEHLAMVMKSPDRKDGNG